MKSGPASTRASATVPVPATASSPPPSTSTTSVSTSTASAPSVVMEERTSSFVEMRGVDSPAPPNRASLKSRSKSQRAPQSPASTPIVSGGARDSTASSQSRGRSNTVVYTESDANQMILRANAPPNYSGGFDSIMKQMKAKKYYTEQFQRIQQQTGMTKLLFFNDEEPFFYESNYLALAQSSSILRVRLLFSVAMIALGAFYASEWSQHKWDASPDNERTDNDKIIIIVLTFGVILPAFLLGLLSTFTTFGKRHLENVTFAVFVIVAGAMIAKKPIEKINGPVIPLLILLIPIFGITRMRFVKSCVIGWSIFFSYFIVMCIAREVVPVKKKFDSYTDISYQTINYGISVIGGMVSQYRQELLRRRNFCLQLPFSGTLDSDALVDMQTDKFSKRSLMHGWSQKFRHPEVEECFYRYWYLIDPFPYENPNSGSLHQGVFMTIRFAVYTLFLNQFVLLLQDVKFLQVKKDANVQPSDFVYAIVLRMGVTVPLYVSAALFMYLVGKAFYAKWVREAEEARNAALARESEVHVDVDVSEPVQGKTAMDGGNDDDPKLKLVVEAAVVKDKSKIKVMDALLNKGGYVRSTQIFSSVVIACHVACMGIILLAVSTGNGKGGKPKPVYYMGFLNAVLFAHRSGFRVRFIYATYTTFVVAVGVIIAASQLSPTYYLEYAGFVSVILVMGMMISYEEENLRRTFFVLKSIRTLEFEEWFSVVLRLQGWVRERFKKKLQTVRSKGSKEFSDNALNTTGSKKNKKKTDPPLINTSAQMAQASKFGMYSQMGNIVIALIDLVTSAIG